MPKSLPPKNQPEPEEQEDPAYITREIRILRKTDEHLQEEARHARHRFVATYIGALLDDRDNRLYESDKGPSIWFPDPRLLTLANATLPIASSPTQDPSKEEKEEKAGGPPELLSTQEEQDVEANLRLMFPDI